MIPSSHQGVEDQDLRYKSTERKTGTQTQPRATDHIQLIHLASEQRVSDMMTNILQPLMPPTTTAHAAQSLPLLYQSCIH